ncbi:hypothetical protein Ahy_B05g079772 isoform A [Arachis hypogaea]|uniref:Uncharacterized protein n=1 Tax=Arachis hypogaea TaxID=3818 RepID=A0A444ZAV7_ARAHY|nr:hypothetical protein Ahy_B05g079772 isoform A [Arachis hypogaea]
MLELRNHQSTIVSLASPPASVADTLQAAKDFLTFAADCSKIFMEERAILQNPENKSQMKGIIRRLLS